MSSEPSAATLYGITNCDTVKKARAWMGEHDREARFHDFKRDGVPEPRLDLWIRAVGWERLLNRQGTTWRKLDEVVRATVDDAPSAKRVMLANPSVIKRPVVEWPDGVVTVGFDPGAWSRR